MMDPNERVIPKISAGFLYQEAFGRYLFALRHLGKGQLVLDIGCGTGYGCAEMAKKAKIIGIDKEKEAIDFAKKEFGDFAEFRLGRAEELDFNQESFDVVCFFEVIEHLKDPSKALGEIVRVLKKNGKLIISTPNRKRISGKNNKIFSKYHKKEYSLKEFTSLLSNFFSKVEVYGQHKSSKAKNFIISFMRSQAVRESLANKDFLKIRKLIPKYLKEKIWRYLGAPFGREIQERLRPIDFPITKTNVAKSDYLVAICLK